MALGSPALRRRLLQAGLAIAAVAAVVIADRTAAAVLRVDSGAAAQRLHSLLVIAGRVVGGWALGLVFRMQLVRSARRDDGIRWLLGVPAGLVCAWPFVLSVLPPSLAAVLPGWARGGVALQIQPFAAVALGLVLALGVRPAKR